MEDRVPALAAELPGGDVAEILVVAPGLVFIGLKSLIKMASARFPSLESIDDHQLGKFKEVSYSSGFFKALIT